MAVLLNALKNQVATSVASKVSQFAKIGSSAGASSLQALHSRATSVQHPQRTLRIL